MKVDVLLVGGGLANGLIALKLSQARPDVRFKMIESGARLGGNHTWSFHRTDLSDAQHEWIDPLVAHRWQEHEVCFPKVRRTLRSEYMSSNSEHFHSVIMAALSKSVILNEEVSVVRPTGAVLKNGDDIQAKFVIDGRGMDRTTGWRVGYQKFLGRVVQLDEPHQLKGPILMDATVEQLDGFRFLYVLPLEKDQLLIEDTRYSDSPKLNREEMRLAISAYASKKGWSCKSFGREEEGVLPIVLDGAIESCWPSESGVSRSGISKSGMRAGLFHPTTGYSLPDAVRLAEMIAAHPLDSSESLYMTLREHALRAWRKRSFFRLLNRMLFRAAKPHLRYRVLERFYTLPDELIERFYRSDLRLRDQARLLFGIPPVPVHKALFCLFESKSVSRVPDIARRS